MSTERLESSRLVLRRPTAADIDRIYATHSDPRTLQHNPGDALESREQAAERFGRWDAHWNTAGFGYFSVELRETGDTIGFCGVKLVSFHGQQVLNLFYRFDPRWWGQGFAGEAAGALAEYIERELSHLPLIAKVRPDNVASHRIVARLGLVEQPSLAEIGEDGFEQVYTRRWPEPDVLQRRCMKENTMDIYEALYTTRAMRRLKPDPVPVDVQARILDAAIRAPSGSNSQPWHFLLVDDAGIRQQLAPLYLEVWQQRLDNEFGSHPPARELENPVLRSAGHLAEHFAETPLLFFGFAKEGAGSSIYPALWSAQLAARAEGVGSTLTTFLNRRQDDVFPILGVPEDEGWQMYGCLTMGYPTGRWGIATRRPAHEVAGRNCWRGALGFEAPEPLWRPGES